MDKLLGCSHRVLKLSNWHGWGTTALGIPRAFRLFLAWYNLPEQMSSFAATSMTLHVLGFKRIEPHRAQMPAILLAVENYCFILSYLIKNYTLFLIVVLRQSRHPPSPVASPLTLCQVEGNHLVQFWPLHVSKIPCVKSDRPGKYSLS